MGQPSRLGRIRSFVGILAWALFDAPHILWESGPFWLIAVVPFILLNLLFQVIQTRIFLLNRGVVIPGWRVPIQFTLKKAVLNIVMSIRTATLKSALGRGIIPAIPLAAH